jgi:hypothetical protein
LAWKLYEAAYELSAPIIKAITPLSLWRANNPHPQSA